jgi:autotransporter passenger strand-loop-strand repeat protein
VVSGGGEQRVVSGGVASATVVSSGGRQYVSSGGAAVDTMASSGGAIDVLAAGTLAGTVVSGGGEAVVSSGGDATGTTVLGGGIVFVRSSGATTGTVVSSGGLALVSSGGLASGTTVLSGGQEVVYSGGVASGTVVSGHGRETISSGAEARGLTVSAGGVVVDDGEVRISGAGTLDGTLSGSGLIVQAAAGDLLLSGSDAAFGGGAVISGGVIELATAGALGSGYAQFVTPTTGSAVLQIDAADAPAAGGTFANTIYDFSSAGEDIDLASIAFVSGASATVSGTTLVLTDGGKTYRFKLGGVIAGAYPVLSDGHGGTLIDPKVLAFAHSLAVFAPPHAANTALASSTSPAGQTPLLHAIAPLSAGRI